MLHNPILNGFGSHEDPVNHKCTLKRTESATRDLCITALLTHTTDAIKAAHLYRSEGRLFAQLLVSVLFLVLS